MSRFITTKADFTLRRRHKKGSGATVYENDYTTINPMPDAFNKEYVIGDSNFKFTTRLGLNGQMKHSRGKFLPPPSGDTVCGWTLDNIIDSGITEESRIRLKPDYNALDDFALYGSAVKLVQGTVNGVITEFPAEMWFASGATSLITINIYKGSEAGYSFNEENPLATSGYVLYNEYGIDMISKNVQPENVTNPLRYLTLCGSSYVLLDSNNTEHPFVGFDVETKASGVCFNGKDIEVDHAATVTLKFEGLSDITIEIYKDNTDDTLYYMYTDQSLSGYHIRPKKQIIEDYFRNADDFTVVLLNRDTLPLYTSLFKTPKETDTGFVYNLVSYTWPSLNGGFNPDLSGPYYSYIQSLIDLAELYDTYFSDHMWRSLTHEAIKTLDWTYVSNSDGDIQDMSEIDTSRIEPITKIYGRQFDDLKRYTDGIKTINTITYNQRSNTPDYTLTDILANSGWETKTLEITTDKDLQTPALYSGLYTGYTSSDANIEFLRRLKINSPYLFSIKGTRKSLDAILAMLGFTPDDYKIHEYVYVFSGSNDYYTSFCDRTAGKSFPYPLADDVATINRYKINFDINDPYGEYCGIPVAEIGFTDSAGTDYSYMVPWFSYGKKYDDGLYFQMNGGWGRRNSKDIDLDIAPDVHSISSFECGVTIYDETQSRLKFANDFDELLQGAYAESKKWDVFYVTDISKIADTYTFGIGESKSGLSHYFVLENAELNQFLGFNGSRSSYGWRNIKEDEYTVSSALTSAGTLVLYLESIKDDTTGNNPHNGNGIYDDGAAYVKSMSDIFGYSTVNKNFIGINDATCDRIKKYKFDVTKQEDNRKCWFFSDDYNTSCGKESGLPGEGGVCSGETITFKEVDVTSGECLIHGVSATSASVKDILLLEEALFRSPVNSRVIVGHGAEPSITSDFEDFYTRNTSLLPFNPEKPGVTTEEGAANSIVNVKNMEVHFLLKPKFREEMRKYINTSVIPYLTQMIPSTTILSWFFDDDADSLKKIESVKVTGALNQVDNTEHVTITGVFEHDPINKGVTVTGKLEQPLTICGATITGVLKQGLIGEHVKVTGTFKQKNKFGTTGLNVYGEFDQNGKVNELNITGHFGQYPIDYNNISVTGGFEQIEETETNTDDNND